MKIYSDTSKIKVFACGRLCLFGEHSDWAGQNRTMNSEVKPGRAIVTGIEQGIYADAYRSDDFCVKDGVGGIEETSFSCEMNRDKLREAASKGGFYSYVCGVASYICEWYRVGGITVEIYEQTLPMKSGLSSSAAVCVLVASAFNQLYDLHLNTEGIMNIAYWGEQRTPSRCGRLDQACAYGVAPVAMTFDGHEVDVARIPVKKNLYYVFSDLMAGKDTVKILSELNKAYPFATNEDGQKLHEALGEDNLNITERAMKYISTGEDEKLGALMTEAQELFDEKIAPMCPGELRSPVLHATLAEPAIQDLIYGGKGVGSQGDGTVQFLAKDERSQKELYDYLSNVKGMTSYMLTLRPNSHIKKAIIPVAGLGTRLYPATRGIKKEFCPIVDKDGLLKPVILILLEELIDSGIEEICLIVNPEEEDFYKNFFKGSVSSRYYDSLPEDLRDYEEKIREISDRIVFAIQSEQKGFGHAVFQACEFTNGEPVILLLGDTIYKSRTDISCTRQLMGMFDIYGRAIISVHEVPIEDVSNYGIFAGTFETHDNNILNIDRIKEKPTRQYAEDYLWIKKEPNEGKKYLAAFGAYVLTKDVFEELSGICSKAVIASARREVELTEALENVMKKDGLLAFIPEGESFDMGNTNAYIKAFKEFGLVC